MCSKRLYKGEHYIRCFTCTKMENTVWCFQCFNEDPKIHLGHRVVVLKSAAGFCDCGDVFAIDAKGFCPKHKGIKMIDESILKSLKPEFIKILSGIYRSYFETVFEWISELYLKEETKRKYFIKAFQPILKLIRDQIKNNPPMTFLLFRVFNKPSNFLLNHVCENI